MVPNIERDYILLLGYSILYKAYNLTGFNHQKNTTHLGFRVEGLTGLLNLLWAHMCGPALVAIWLRAKAVPTSRKCDL